MLEKGNARRFDFLRTIFPLIVVWLSTSLTVKAQTPNTGWYEANPTATHFTISSADELAGLATIVNGTWGGTPAEFNFFSTTITLNGNIDLTAYQGGDGWMPIGQNAVTNHFEGDFDGNGYEITGLRINRPTSSYTGLFGYTLNATIKNLGVRLADDGINPGVIGNTDVGGLVGYFLVSGSSNNKQIFNCYVIGYVKGIGTDVGGLVGRMCPRNNGTSSIENCFTSGNVAAVSQVGGLAGIVVVESGTINSSAQIINCYSTCHVSSSGNEAGGLVGKQLNISGNNANNEVIRCYSTGTVTAGVNRAGGIVAYQNSSAGGSISVNSCFSTSPVNGSGSLGAIIGWQEGGATPIGTYMNSLNFRYENVNVGGSSPVTNDPTHNHGGRLTAVQLMMDGTYTGWDFTSGTAWHWDHAEKFPMLKLGIINSDVDYPFPFYSLSFDLDGGAFTIPVTLPICPDFDSYIPDALIIPYAMPTPLVTDNLKKFQYQFNGWNPNGIAINDNGHKLFKALWTKFIFDVTIDPAITNGRVVASNPNYPPPTYTSPLAEAGQTVTLDIIPDAGCRFKSLTIYKTDDLTVFSTVTTISSNTYSFPMPGYDVTLFVEFETNFMISISPSYGGAVTSDKVSAYAGEVVTLTATPNTDSRFNTLTVYETGNSSNHMTLTPVGSTDGVFTFVMPAYGVTVSSVFDLGSRIHVSSNLGGTIVSNRSSAFTGDAITVTVTPAKGYEIASITSLEISLNTYTSQDNSRIYSFSMPSSDVSISVEFQKTARQIAWELVAPLIESATFKLKQMDAATETAARYALAALINEWIAGTGFVITPDDIVVFSSVPATLGVSENPSGTDGIMSFRVSPPDVSSSAYNDVVITATPYIVSNFFQYENTTLTGWAHNGKLFMKGLTVGQSWSVYSLSGALVCQGIATEKEAEIRLPSSGLFIVICNGKTVKIIN